MKEKPEKHFIKLLLRMVYLFFIKPAHCPGLVQRSYDRISENYDKTWTSHMRDITESLIDRLNPQKGDISIDLTCGTGFATNLIAERTKSRTVGVDSSQEMLCQARQKYGHRCDFTQSDVLEYLKRQSSSSVDIVSCCWGLGYSKPFAVIRQIKRILRPAGKIAIVDNTLFSLREILFCSFLTFAEQPDKLVHLMRFRFLPGYRSLCVIFRLLGMKSLYLASGVKSYTVSSGQVAIDRLRATGASAGFEYAADPADEREIFGRFAEIIEDRYRTENGIAVTHRYLAGIAQKCY